MTEIFNITTMGDLADALATIGRKWKIDEMVLEDRMILKLVTEEVDEGSQEIAHVHLIPKDRPVL